MHVWGVHLCAHACVHISTCMDLCVFQANGNTRVPSGSHWLARLLPHPASGPFRRRGRASPLRLGRHGLQTGPATGRRAGHAAWQLRKHVIF